MTRKQIIERIDYWTGRECYKQARIWRDLLTRHTVQVIRSPHTAEPVTNTINNGGR